MPLLSAMAMDPFKKVFVVGLAVSLVALGFVAYIALNAIAIGNIPDSESGTITARGAVTDGRAADYFVALSSGKVLYIESNSTLFDVLAVNSSYSFTCRVVYLENMIVIDSATLKV
jgi:hypothetical protein